MERMFVVVPCLAIALSGCAPVMLANIAAATALNKGAANHRADRCYKVETAYAGQGTAIMNRELRRAGCMR